MPNSRMSEIHENVLMHFVMMMLIAVEINDIKAVCLLKNKLVAIFISYNIHK